MYNVARQVEIAALASRVWQCLTQPSLLARWFADTDRFEPGLPLRLEFGDGDFFVGAIREWDEPACLRLEWKFMGLGALYDVAFFLTPLPGPGTELTVVDRGCLTLDEMNALRDGWGDFLGRLDKYARTGESARFAWSETIGMGAVVSAAGVPNAMRAPSWWQAAFPDAEVRTRETRDGGLVARFRSAAWGRLETEAHVSIERVPAGAALSVLHQGWPELPDGVALAERRRYAERWQRALESLEAEAGARGQPVRTAGAASSLPARARPELRESTR